MLSITNMSQYQGMSWYGERDASSGTAALVIVTFGKCIYWINGHKALAEKGDLILIEPGAQYYGKSVPTVFHEQFVIEWTYHEPIAKRFPSNRHNGYVKSKAGCYELVVERLRNVWKEWQEDAPYSSLRAASLALDALALWGRELDRGEEDAISMQHAERMKAYIQDHYRGKITKEHLGECIGRSPNHAASLFRRVTGQTISEFVHNVRMRTAVYLLKESLLTVTEIAEYLGYSDASYFQRIFKRTTGLSPSAYLKDRPLQV